MLIYFIIINIIAVLVTLYDKYAAGARHRRIPERILFGIGVIGGALGMFITMLLIRHKTKHVAFMTVLPIAAIVHIVLLIIIL